MFWKYISEKQSSKTNELTSAVSEVQSKINYTEIKLKEM